MDASFATIVVSAFVGGLAGSLFPSLKRAISYVIFEGPVFISKEEAKARFDAEQSASRAKFLLDIHKRTISTRDAACKARDLFDRLKDPRTNRNDLEMETAALLVDLKNAIAYLQVFDGDSLDSIHAALLVQLTIDFACFNVALIESIFESTYSKLGEWIDLEGAFTTEARLKVKWGSSLSGIEGALERLDRGEKEQRRLRDFHLQETIDVVNDAKRKQLWYSVFLGLSFLVICLALLLRSHWPR